MFTHIIFVLVIQKINLTLYMCLFIEIIILMHIIPYCLDNSGHLSVIYPILALILHCFSTDMPVLA